MPFEIVRNDLNQMQSDAVVRVVDDDFDLDLAIERDRHIKDESCFFDDREQNAHISLDDVVIVPVCNQEAKYVIYIKSPMWQEAHLVEEVVASCYRKVLYLANAYHCDSIAFPLIDLKQDAKELALQVAIREIGAFLVDYELQVYLVVSNPKDFVISENLFDSVSRYIDENYNSEMFDDVVDTESVDGALFECSSIESFQNDRIYKEIDFFGDVVSLPDDYLGSAELLKFGELLQDLDAGFSETLLKLIDRTGKKDSEIYKKANVDRKLFSKIRNNADYQPSKRTALAFAFALELDLEETEDFIGRAGYRLSHSNKFDVIVEYFLINKNYNVFELNEVLFAFDQPLIGA